MADHTLLTHTPPEHTHNTTVVGEYERDDKDMIRQMRVEVSEWE